MFFPGGLAGLLMMHVPVFKLGKARLLICLRPLESLVYVRLWR